MNKRNIAVMRCVRFFDNKCIMLLVLFFPTFSFSQTGSLIGTVKDSSSGETLIGVNVYISSLKMGATTDQYGQFTIKAIPVGEHDIQFSMVGYKTENRKAIIQTGVPTKIEISLQQQSIKIQEIVVTPGHYGINKGAITSSELLNVNEVKKIPGAQGDVFMALATMPGIVSIGPSAPIYVQGGRPEENLVLFDHGLVASAFHMELAAGGVYSIFNSALLQKVDLYSGGFSAEYGDRLSGVLDVKTREGLLKSWLVQFLSQWLLQKVLLKDRYQ